MQIVSIHLKNIKSHRDTELSFAPGINVLSGPNGVGKSTVFEAIGYALFGVDARDFVSNVERFLTIGAKKGEISVIFATDANETWRVNRTVGTPAKWLLAKEAGYAQIKMPSGETRMVPAECMATVGAVSNPDNSNVSIGKAGRMRWKGRRPVVRGVAMNPIDHPHGGGEGRTSGGRHPCTPWGKPTKGYKTRSRKPSDAFIVRRRNAK